MAKKQISVIERRLQSGSALAQGSVSIPLHEPGWTLRWENSEVAPDHVWRAVNIKGWEYVVPADVACSLDEVGASERENRVVRGERGKEVLLKMRLADYKKIQQMKTKENLKITFDKKKVKEGVVGAVAGEHGDEAANFINKNVLSVTDSRERVPLDE